MDLAVMKFLLIHQNFPGQYLYLAQHLRALPGNEVVGVGDAANIEKRGTISGMLTLGYPPPQGAGEHTHPYLQTTEKAVRRGQAAARALLQLRDQGFVPDVIYVHPGWGEGLFVRDVFPDTPILMFAEYFFRSGQADIGFDPEFPRSPDWNFSVRIRNATQLISLPMADVCISPTRWQASRYPACLRDKIRVIHDGVNTDYMRPDNNARLVVQPLEVAGESRVISSDGPPSAQSGNDMPGDSGVSRDAEGARAEGAPGGEPLVFRYGDPVVLYVARNLEPYRGFHVFLRSLPELQRRYPDVHTLIVGADSASYSPTPVGATYKRAYLEALRTSLDLSRIHFFGRIPYADLRAMYRVAAAHVYLTYPFVLSWSMLESMACEGLLVASRTPPVEEVIVHGTNGLLVDFFDQKALVDQIGRALDSPRDFLSLRATARETVLARYELGSCLAAQVKLLQDLAAGLYPAPE
jgi:glycosyltransferase involved in cell wall biosynthesis